MDATNFGHRLLAQVVDQFSQTDGERVYASVQRSANVLDGFEEVTMRAMATMINNVSWWVHRLVPPASPATVAYVGTTDLRYPIIFLATMKTGHKMMFISPRNTVSQNRDMLRRVGCKVLFYAQEMADIAEQVKTGELEMTLEKVPSFAEMLASKDSDVTPYIWSKTFDEIKNEKCLILHSSGSTGNPKLVSMTHATFAVTDNDRYMRTPSNRQAQNSNQFNFNGGGRFFSCFPPYHLAGVHAYITLPIFSTAATVVLGPPSLPPSGHLLADIMKQQRLQAFYVPPYIIEQWTSTQEAEQAARHLDFILFGGGPLPPAIGDSLSKVTNVCQMYGSLEIGHVQLLVPQPGEWSYMELNPFEDVDMQAAGDGVFEMILRQNDQLRLHRSLTHNFPEVQTWRTGDLFTPHPTKAGLWRFDSRIDDLIVLSTGYKIRPLEMEMMIQGNPRVNGVLIVGQGRPQPLLLIEPRPGAYDGDSQRFVESIWSSVVQANQRASSYGQLTRSNTLIASADKPFTRSPKGSIVRKLTVADYNAEIDALFSEATMPSRAKANIEDYMLPGIRLFVGQCIRLVMPDTMLLDNDDIFLHGLDSLKATEFGRQLRLGLSQQMKSDLSKLSLRLIYRHPTIESLAAAILTIMSGADPDGNATKSSSESMQSMVEELTQNFETLRPLQQTPLTKEGLNVAVIGPRGTLGSYIIHSILQDSRPRTVYCLARGEAGKQRLTSSFRDRGLFLNTEDDRLRFMSIDLSKPKFGVSEREYDELLSNVDLVIHNAWKVDFSLTLESYGTEFIRSIRTMIDFGIHSLRRPRMAFISSISSVQEWATIYSTPVTEESLPVYEVASPLGYGQSKHVSERILVRASQALGVPVTILRVGQVAGPSSITGGQWSVDEWIPSIARISKILGTVPSDIPQIDWIPVDLTARSICEILLPPGMSLHSELQRSLQVYNLVNPSLTPWSTFANALKAKIGPATKLVSLQKWVESLAHTDPNNLPLEEATSSIKILPFFQHLSETVAAGVSLQPLFETTKARSASDTLRNMKAIDIGLIEMWCTQWGI